MVAAATLLLAILVFYALHRRSYVRMWFRILGATFFFEARDGDPAPLSTDNRPVSQSGLSGDEPKSP